ncbi:ETM [Choristoneura rosaceana nucleopolyhedrovirus]|uniref:ETM n=1 Tax=Choristoneura rosaceana nucleopolyhedrovirus TaxID=58094 RepID=S5MR69_9ABAC|nr:ETM [Choristoneura rosaceana nucleopolyhedrovirus]AGR57138.1 ETM [Choristoneura rosaceana nucleopolyhedrovirus]
MDALQSLRVRVDKHYACRRALFETPNCASFTFDRTKVDAQIANIEISGLRQQYECFGKMVVADSVVHVRERSVNGKIVVPINGAVDFFTAVLKSGLEFIYLNVYVINRCA